MHEINSYIIAMKVTMNLYNKGEYTSTVVPGIVMKDGFTISIQASNTHYCDSGEIGGKDDIYKEHQFFELGFPSEVEELILEYAEDEHDPMSGVYAHVPLNVVEYLIRKHGGIDYRTTLKKIIERSLK